METKIKLQVTGLTYSHVPSGAYILLLGEETGNRKLPVIIGELETESIANVLKGVESKRPQTHDLFASFVLASFSSLKSALIYKFEEGIFYAKVNFVTLNEEEIITLECRTSDAVALALRFNAPIYTTEEVLEAAGVEFGEGEDLDGVTITDEPETIEALTESLQKAIDEENYEQASYLRDKINQKK